MTIWKPEHLTSRRKTTTPIPDWSGIQIMTVFNYQTKMGPSYSYEPGIWVLELLNTGFQFVWYSNGSGIQMFCIQILTVPYCFVQQLGHDLSLGRGQL
jgi:hypothetical protein